MTTCPKCGSQTPIGHRCIVDDLEAIRTADLSGHPLMQAIRDAAPERPLATVADAIAAWEAKGPTSLTVALMAEALYMVREVCDQVEANPVGWGGSPVVSLARTLHTRPTATEGDTP